MTSSYLTQESGPIQENEHIELVCRNHGVIWQGTFDQLRGIRSEDKTFTGSVPTGTEWMECNKCLTFLELRRSKNEFGKPTASD